MHCKAKYMPCNAPHSEVRGQLGSQTDSMPYLDLSISLFKIYNMPVSWSILQHDPVLKAISKELWGIVFMVILVHSVVI